MRRAVKIEYGDDVLLNLGMSPDQFDQEAKLLLAAKLYELGRLTSGQAAHLAGMGRVDFLMSLARLGIAASNVRADEAETELDFGRNG